MEDVWSGKLGRYRHRLCDVVGDGEVVGLAVTLAVGRNGHIPADGVLCGPIPVLFHHDISVVVNLHKLPDDGQVLPGMHDDAYHALELPVRVVVVVGTEEPEQVQAALTAESHWPT